MGEKTAFQPLTRGDKLSVIIYRAGIALTTLLLCLGAYLFMRNYGSGEWERLADSPPGYGVTVYVILLYVSVGMSVFSIHLYVGRFKRYLKRLYYLSLVALIVLLLRGRGDLGPVVFAAPEGPLFLLPLSGCIGFITAKEAFCFRLNEGYLLALLMPLYLISLSLRVVTPGGAALGLVLLAGLMAVFALRKVPMPMHYDIGDKSAYQP